MDPKFHESKIFILLFLWVYVCQGSVPNSEDYSTPNSLILTIGQSKQIICNTGFEGGGNILCLPSGEFTDITCDSTGILFKTVRNQQHIYSKIEPLKIRKKDIKHPLILSSTVVQKAMKQSFNPGCIK